MRSIRRAGVCRPALLLAVAACAVGGPAAAHAAPVETVLQDDALFLHGTDAEVADGLARLRALGIDRVRLTAGWSVIAPQPNAAGAPDFDAADPAAYPAGNWGNLDRAVRMAVSAGVRPMIDIAFWAPRWATTEQADVPNRLRTGVDAARFAAFARAVARRYNGTWRPPPGPVPPPEPSQDGNPFAALLGRREAPAPPPPAPVRPDPLPAVDTFTIWNEPNHPGFLLPQWAQEDGHWIPASADAYRAMVQAAYPAIKAAAPASTVLVGGTSSLGSDEPPNAGVPPLRFLRRLACVDDEMRPITTGGCADFKTLPGDGWSHHPYSLRWYPDRVPRDRDEVPVGALGNLAVTLRELVRRGRLAPRVADLYLTEYGYETNLPDPQARFSQAQQAGLLAWAEDLALRVPGVRMWPQFLLRDRPGDPAGRRTAPSGTGRAASHGRRRAQAGVRDVPRARARLLRDDPRPPVDARVGAHAPGARGRRGHRRGRPAEQRLAGRRLERPCHARLRPRRPTARRRPRRGRRPLSAGARPGLRPRQLVDARRPGRAGPAGRADGLPGSMTRQEDRMTSHTTITIRRIALVLSAAVLATAIVAMIAAGPAAADPVHPMSDGQAYRASCGHLGVPCSDAADEGRRTTRARGARRRAAHRAAPRRRA